LRTCLAEASLSRPGRKTVSKNRAMVRADPVGAMILSKSSIEEGIAIDFGRGGRIRLADLRKNRRSFADARPGVASEEIHPSLVSPAIEATPNWAGVVG
jgi:hypothetical protein